MDTKIGEKVPFRYLYHIVYVTRVLYHKYAILEQYASIPFNFAISFPNDISGWR